MSVRGIGRGWSGCRGYRGDRSGPREISVYWQQITAGLEAALGQCFSVELLVLGVVHQ